MKTIKTFLLVGAVALLSSCASTANNVGRLINKNAETATLTTSTPFNVKEIIITAEGEGNLTYPRGIEISRTTFSK